MAEYFLKSLDPSLEVDSAGTAPAAHINAKTVAVMNEIGISLAGAQPKGVDRFLGQSFDYAITVCDNARETCPVFIGKVQHRLHMGFDDPAEAVGTEEQIMNEYRRVRDEIRTRFTAFYNDSIKPNHP